MTPTSGRLFVGGVDLTRKPAHVFARAGIARTFQTPRVFADMTVAESVRFGLEFAGRRRRAEHAALGEVPDILGFLGLGESAALPARAVTPARQRLLEIGMALATRPRVLLLDEVAAGLTQTEVAGVARLVRRCRDELGLSVVWIEHAVACCSMPSSACSSCIRAGRSPREVRARSRAIPEVIEAYLGAGAAETRP